MRLLLALSADIVAVGLSLPCSAAIILYLKRICFRGQETKLSVSSVRHQKAQLHRLPSRGACREMKVRAKPGLNQASVWNSSIGGGSVRSRATAVAVAARSVSYKVDAVTSDVVCCIFFPQQCSTDLLPF